MAMPESVPGSPSSDGWSGNHHLEYGPRRNKRRLPKVRSQSELLPRAAANTRGDPALSPNLTFQNRLADPVLPSV